MPKTAKKPASGTVNQREIAQFAAIADEWWDEDGKFKPLHRINPVRLSYIRQQICAHFNRDENAINALKDLTILDVGCGGGLLSEPLARQGAIVTGVDAAAESIEVAKAHAKQSGLNIDYRAMTTEELAAQKQKFDCVMPLEIIEHVADVDLFLSSCAALVKPGGLLILSTLNRTAKSFLLGVVAAEYILRWVPQGTHDWRKFLRPSQIANGLRQNGLTVTDISGMIFNPLKNDFELSKSDIAVNYILTARK